MDAEMILKMLFEQACHLFLWARIPNEMAGLALSTMKT